MSAKTNKKAKPRKPKSQGLGDTIKKVTKKTGIDQVVKWFSDKTGIDCGCEERRQFLNKLIRYRNRINCMTLAQYDRWTFVRESILDEIKSGGKIGMPSLKAIYEIHRALFGLPLEFPCPSCRGSIKVYIQMTQQVEDMYKSYTDQEKKQE